MILSKYVVGFIILFLLVEISLIFVLMFELNIFSNNMETINTTASICLISLSLNINYILQILIQKNIDIKNYFKISLLNHIAQIIIVISICIFGFVNFSYNNKNDENNKKIMYFTIIQPLTSFYIDSIIRKERIYQNVNNRLEQINNVMLENVNQNVNQNQYQNDV